METCFVPSTRRDTTPTFPSSSRLQQAGLDLSVELAGDAIVVRVKTAKLTYPVLSAFFDDVRAVLEEGSTVLGLFGGELHRQRDDRLPVEIHRHGGLAGRRELSDSAAHGMLSTPASTGSRDLRGHGARLLRTIRTRIRRIRADRARARVRVKFGQWPSARNAPMISVGGRWEGCARQRNWR